MTRALRIAYVLLAWLYLAGLVTVAFAAGLGLLVPDSTMDLHIESGYILHLAPILLLLAAWGARVGRPTIWWVIALTVSGLIQPLLPALRESVPFLAALHPLNAMVLFYLSFTVAWRSRAFLAEQLATA
ncbi:MAG TPA: hypothetical protein VGB34_05560 [Candidatus Limnocylindria bacterium]